MLRSLVIAVILSVCLPLAAIKIGRISFEGFSAEETAILVKASALQTGEEYQAESVATATRRLYEHFHSQGKYFYLIPSPELKPIDSEALELVYRPSEYRSASAVQLKFRGNSYFSEAKLNQLLLGSEASAYPLKRIPRLMEQILELYHARAYLFAAVSLDSLVQSDQLIAYIGIEEGKPLRIKEYVIRGNKITRAKTIIKLTGLNQLSTITPAALIQARENLLRKSYISDCVIEPLDPNNLLIRLEEGKMTHMEGLVGMSRINNKLEFSGHLRLQFLNLWGSDRAIKLYLKQVPNTGSELSLFYHDPGFNAVPIAADLELKRTEQDSTWMNTLAALDVYYQLLQQEIGISLETESLKPGTRFPPTVVSTNSTAISAFWNYNRVEGGLNPWKGFGYNLRYGLVNSSGDSKLRTTAELGGFGLLPFSTRWVGYVNLQARSIGNPEAEAWQQYKLGGYASLRGYHEDEFSAYRLGWINYELRYRLSADSRIYVLFDQGFLGKDKDTISRDLFGLGGGIKFQTKLGILGIEYALGYRDNHFSRIGLGMIHAGLSTFF